MRKIEKEMIEAIKAKKNYSNDNTRVIVSEDGNYIKVELHGNLIAQIWVDSKLMFSDCGYQTKTTKSRLNAILNHFELPTIYSINFQWYIGTEVWNGNTSHLILDKKKEESVYTFKIPENCLSLIFNDDASGLSEEDIEAWKQFEQQMITDGFSNGYWSYPDNTESYFSYSNDIHNLGDNVVDLQWVGMS